MKNKYLLLAREAWAIADSKKAKNPLLLNVKALTCMADYFLIVTAESTPQITAVSEGVYRAFRDKHGLYPSHRDGKGSPNWAVIDYGGLVVHVMKPDYRRLYALDKIWNGARKLAPSPQGKRLRHG